MRWDGRSPTEKPTFSHCSQEYPELINKQTQTLNTLQIDQIRSELFEEQHSPLVEPEYWDESHNWSIDDPSHSSDYWHFLGQYE